MTTSPPLRFVFVLCLQILAFGIHKGQASFTPEFIRSFLTRPWMLTNNSLNEPPVRKSNGEVTLSLYLDNWSSYNLVLAKDSIISGVHSQSGLEPRDLGPLSRELVLRSSSSQKNEKTAGLVSWTLTDNNKVKLARLSIGNCLLMTLITYLQLIYCSMGSWQWYWIQVLGSIGRQGAQL